MRGGPPPPPIIFERLKLPQQIIYRRKENLSESPNHQKYWENILVSRFYEQFSRNRQNLGHFQKFKKFPDHKESGVSAEKRVRVSRLNNVSAEQGVRGLK